MNQLTLVMTDVVDVVSCSG